MNIIEMIIYR